MFRVQCSSLFACDEAGQDFIVYDNCMSHRLIFAAARSTHHSGHHQYPISSMRMLGTMNYAIKCDTIRSVDPFTHAIRIKINSHIFHVQFICTLQINVCIRLPVTLNCSNRINMHESTNVLAF